MMQLNGQLQDLKLFCIQNLKRHYHPEEHLFFFRKFLDPQQNDPRLSFRYSVIALLGLLVHKNHPLVQQNFDLEEMFCELVIKSRSCHLIQELGLMLWLDACCGCGKPEILLKRLEELAESKREPYLATYELAWLLTGVSYAAKQYPDSSSADFLQNYSHQLFQQLKERYNSETHLFFHYAPVSLRRKIRRPISDFADQIYSIYACLTYFELTVDQRAVEIAGNCTGKILELQGPNGEWWWLYNTSKGTIAYRYPVYTVHQDGMAPMVLMKMEKVTHLKSRAAILKSFGWVFHPNGTTIFDHQNQKIVRGIRLATPYLKHLAAGFSLLNLDLVNEKLIYRFFRKQRTIDEFRAYHLGWVLYFMHYWEQMQTGEKVKNEISESAGMSDSSVHFSANAG